MPQRLPEVQRVLRGALVKALACCVLALVAAAAPARAATVAPPRWDRGFVFTAFWHDHYATFDAGTSLRRLRATGADSVALIATWYQPNARSSAVEPDPFRTPSDESLGRIAREAKSLGLKVVMRPVVDVEDGTSRTDIDPELPDLWFESYTGMVDHYARLAEAEGVDSLQVGVELRSLSTRYAARWPALIAGARSLFGGELSYAANWDEYGAIPWWGGLDVIAIDAYFPLAADRRPRSEDEIVRAWSGVADQYGGHPHYLDEIASVQRRFAKPVIFSEVGYPSAEGNLLEPWRPGGVYSADAQVRALDAAIRALAGEPWFRGMYVWQWRAERGQGGPGDTDHTPQGKPAERSLTESFGGI